MAEQKNRLTIMLISGNNAPIPDVLGGGAERLVTMLADQNEIENRVKFIIISPFHPEAEKESLTYKNSQFIYMKKNNLLVKIRNMIVLCVYKLTGCYFRKKGYYSNIFRKIDPSTIDIAIDENGYVPEIKYITDSLGKNRVLSHIHWDVDPSRQRVDSFYGGIIGVSDYVAASWLAHSTDENLKKMVVYSAVDEKNFRMQNEQDYAAKIRQRYGISQYNIVFLYCGRLDAQKGVLELIKAFKRLSDKNLSLLIVGGSYLIDSEISDYEKQLKNTAADDKRILFTGYVSNNELYQFYMASDIQVIPTIVEEAAGLVAIEGMLMGLPIIATNSGGLPEYLSAECAAIINKGANMEQDLAEAMKKLYLNDKLRKRMSEASVINAKRFSQRKYYNDFIDCIETYSSNL